MAEEWGPWNEHDGKGCPVIGLLVLMEYADGAMQCGYAQGGESWFWGCASDETTWAVWGDVPCIPITRYRVRRPDALRRLIDIAEDPTKGLPPRFPVEELA